MSGYSIPRVNRLMGASINMTGEKCHVSICQQPRFPAVPQSRECPNCGVSEGWQTFGVPVSKLGEKYFELVKTRKELQVGFLMKVEEKV